MTDHPHLDQLIDTMAVLRGEDGCQWDRQQTHESLVTYLIEEVHELVDAIERGDRQEIREELGDVLYQVLFHADIARCDPDDPFDLDEVARLVNDKMRRRHPHVFAGVAVDGVEDITRNWQAIKAEEKGDRTSVLDGVPDSLDGVTRVRAVLTRARRLGVSPPSQNDTPSSVVESDAGIWGEWLVDTINRAELAGIDTAAALRQALRNFEDTVRAGERADGEPGR